MQSLGKNLLVNKSIGNGEVMAQNEEFNHIGLMGSKNAKIFNDALIFTKMRIVYSSVYDQKWEYIYDPELPNGSVTNKLN